MKEPKLLWSSYRNVFLLQAKKMSSRLSHGAMSLVYSYDVYFTFKTSRNWSKWTVLQFMPSSANNSSRIAILCSNNAIAYPAEAPLPSLYEQWLLGSSAVFQCYLAARETNATSLHISPFTSGLSSKFTGKKIVCRLGKKFKWHMTHYS